MNRTLRLTTYFAARSLAGLLLLVAASPMALAANSSDVANHRAHLVLPAAPADAQQVLAARKQLAANSKTPGALKSSEVTVTGQIGGMPNVWPDTHPNFPWYAGQSSFFLVDSAVAKQFDAHAHHHGGGTECAFCKSLASKNAGAIAVVNLVDENGQILKIDTRDLLALKENQSVIVRGNARILGGNLLVIDATGIYVNETAAAARTTGKSAK